ncbi:hypothetical protein CK222_30405 [Mesorhizobium sp. WSM3866]|nr:hypothetical protein CK222_30405 [Mesorhizobium sp. WSM3866]
MRSGGHWHDIPESYGKWKTLHQLFRRGQRLVFRSVGGFKPCLCRSDR